MTEPMPPPPRVDRAPRALPPGDFNVSPLDRLKRGENPGEVLQSWIQEHPPLAIGGGLALGFLVGVWLRR